MAWQPPADAIPWTPPVDAIPTTEGAPYDPAAIGMDVPADVRYEVAPQEPPPTDWVQSLFPRSAARAYAGEPVSGWAGALDAYSLPFRLGATTVQQAAGALTRQGNPATFAEDLGRTAGEAELPWYMRLPDTMARDPMNALTAPAVVATGGLSVPASMAASRIASGARPVVAAGQMALNTLRQSRPVVGGFVSGALKGTPLAALIAGTQQAENVAAGRPTSAGEAATTFGLSSLIGGGFGALPGIGAKMQRGGIEALRQMVKPTSTEIEGFYQAMDAGLLPEAAGPFTLTQGGAGQRYIDRMKKQAEKAYGPAMKQAEEGGQTVNMQKVYEAARDYVRKEVDDANLSLGESDIDATAKWLSEKILYRDAASRKALQEANIPLQGRYVPLRGQKEVREMVPGRFRFDESGQPIPSATSKVSGYSPTVEGFEKLPDYYQPIPDVTRPVIPAHRLKSALQDLAWSGKEPLATAPKAGMIAGAKGAGREIRRQIAEVSPLYAEADARMAPWYAGEDAFRRAADVRGNNYWGDALAFGLGAGPVAAQGGALPALASGTGLAAMVRYLRAPAFARHLYEAGRGASAVGRANVGPLAQYLIGAPTDNARGR